MAGSRAEIAAVGDYLRSLIDGDGVSVGLYDDDPPTGAAKAACLAQLTGAAEALPPGGFPAPHIAADGSGGIYCEWNRGSRSAVVTFSPAGDGRLHVFGRESDGVPGGGGISGVGHHTLPDPGRLAAALGWVAGAS